MFERYTEKARRVIFFARFEASQFGSPYIESEHLLLALLREDKALAFHFLKSQDVVDFIRSEVERRVESRPSTSTSVDLPLSQEAKRILAYGAEESERLNHRWIGPPHLLLGILREPNSLAAKMLGEHGVRLEAARQEVTANLTDVTRTVERTVLARPEAPNSLLKVLSDLEQAGGITVGMSASVAGHFVDIAVYEGRDVPTGGDSLSETQEAEPSTRAGKVALLRKRLRDVLRNLENAIATHEFVKARTFSEEERRIREELMQTLGSEEASGGDPAVPAPLLCILLLADESLAALRAQIELFFERGVQNVWLLHPASRRIYTATAADGLRELTGETLRSEHPKIEIDRRQIFG